jgi:hypothetical protein
LAAVDPAALSILLTQDCDILNHDYRDEPDAELHVAWPAAEVDGNLLNAKNPRSHQFKVTDRLYEIRMLERGRAPRECLLGHVPQELNLDSDDHLQITSIRSHPVKAIAIGGKKSALTKNS